MDANKPLHDLTSIIDCFSDLEDPRVEVRHYTFFPLMYLFPFKKIWRDVQTFIQVKNCVWANGEEKWLTRYYISSLSWEKTNKIKEAIRHHWHVENKLH